MAETKRRREKQMAHNRQNGITPESVKKNIADILEGIADREDRTAPGPYRVREALAEAQAPLLGGNLRSHIEGLEAQMREAAADLEFETAARLRDEIKRLQETELAIADDPFARQSDVEQKLADAEGKAVAPKRPKRGRRRPGP